MIKITSETLPLFQEFLVRHDLDAWLLYDFHELNPFAHHFLPLDEGVFTRRWFYLLPAEGMPKALVHRIEESYFLGLTGEILVYSGWRELEEALAGLLTGRKRVAMEYSPGCALPYVSKVDAGTLELVRLSGVEVVSSGDIIQYFHSRWTLEGYTSHKATVPLMHQIRERAFETIAGAVRDGRNISEYTIQQQIAAEFNNAGLITDDDPIVAVDSHAALPHYTPTKSNHAPIKEGNLVLIDMWAKKADNPEATYVDITWTGYVGDSVPEKIARIFDLVKQARETAVSFIAKRLASGEPVTGMEVDQTCRRVIEQAGYGAYFTHRTGHSIDTEVHGAGVNIDALEVRDNRRLIPGAGFSIEPGIYLPGEFGIRSEIDAYISESSIEVTTAPSQEKVLALLK
ncbi:MAG: M24 family metallopeptidase [Fidelibacterota bacterium]|nr:MAG: M24 family metallopeptidase [Candidatus Neomarinimicrobiota bacterium]